MKKIVDERQERELLKVEHYGFWIMFWALFASIIFQIIFFDNGTSLVGGEMVVLLISAVAIIIGCCIKGVWCYTSEPTIKNYLIYDVLFTILYGIIFGVERYMHSNYFRNNIKMFVLTIGIFSAFMFVFIFVLLFISGEIVKKRRTKLEDQFNDDDM